MGTSSIDISAVHLLQVIGPFVFNLRAASFQLERGDDEQLLLDPAKDIDWCSAEARTTFGWLPCLVVLSGSLSWNLNKKVSLRATYIPWQSSCLPSPIKCSSGYAKDMLCRWYRSDGMKQPKKAWVVLGEGIPNYY